MHEQKIPEGDGDKKLDMPIARYIFDNMIILKKLKQIRLSFIRTSETANSQLDVECFLGVEDQAQMLRANK